MKAAASPSVSILITAPAGIGSCAYLDDWLAELGTARGEIIVADASERCQNGSRGRIRHLHFPGASLQGLMSAGAARATGDWVLVSEDHCRPLPGIFAEYGAALASNPCADLIAGAVDNLTSRSPWSVTDFLIGLSDFWRGGRFLPATASNANVLIRRSAMLPEELAVPGGLFNRTIPRLSRPGRRVTCRDAVVDHVVHLDRAGAVRFQIRVTREAVREGREIEEPRSLLADIWHSIKRALGCAFLVPARVAKDAKGTPHGRLPALLRVAYVCARVAWRLGVEDWIRIAARLRHTPDPRRPRADLGRQSFRLLRW